MSRITSVHVDVPLVLATSVGATRERMDFDETQANGTPVMRGTLYSIFY